MILELKKISKHFGRIKANDAVNLKIRPGMIHGILGENGAGKSTLMKILAGYLQRDSGTILANGKELSYLTPKQAARRGIGMLYQEPLDFPALTVLQNFLLGQTRGRLCRLAVHKRRFMQLADELGFQLSPDEPVSTLTLGERRQLEIIRLLSMGVRVLILDEPTTGISGLQKEVLFQALRAIKAEGRSVVIISHKLGEVMELCDMITVLRAGRVVGGMQPPYREEHLLQLMFSAQPQPQVREQTALEPVILSFENVCAEGSKAGLSSCTVEIRQGEVVGLAGLEGSGQELFLRLACGLEHPSSGSINISGIPVRKKEYRSLRGSGVAFLPANRLEEGLLAGMSITEHSALELPSSLFIYWRQAYARAMERIRRFQIKGRPATKVEELSGGNQQRLLISFLPEKPRLLLLENPARGLDLHSMHWVWDHLHAYARAGASVVFSSSELDEILMAADRVLVFFEGRIILDVPVAAADAGVLGMALAGRTGVMRLP